MAMYTMELREIVEQATQFENLPHRERIERGRKNLFDFDYPIFDENYRKVFETNFIRNFYMREIGFETEGLFKFQLETWLLINMSYYNKMFESELLEYDPLTNTKYRVEHNKKNDKLQNNLLDKTKNDVNTRSQLDVRDGLKNEDRIKTQLDNRDIKQNENVITTENINKEINRNDFKNLDGLETERTNNTTDNTSDIKNTIKSDVNRDSKTSSDNTENKENNYSVDDFTRDLKSNTPDGRLAITTQDGKGVIEYASQIDEKTDNKKHKTTEKNTSKILSDVNDKSLMNNEETGNEKSLENFNGNKTNEIGESERLESTINDNTLGNKSDNKTSTTGDILNSNVNDKNNTSTKDTLDSKVDDRLNSQENEKLNIEVNDIEDFLQYSFGKTGTITFPELVQKYRESLLRIEKEIFREMNQLFMLVY